MTYRTRAEHTIGQPERWTSRKSATSLYLTKSNQCLQIHMKENGTPRIDKRGCDRIVEVFFFNPTVHPDSIAEFVVLRGHLRRDVGRFCMSPTLRSYTQSAVCEFGNPIWDSVGVMTCDRINWDCSHGPGMPGKGSAYSSSRCRPRAIFGTGRRVNETGT